MQHSHKYTGTVLNFSKTNSKLNQGNLKTATKPIENDVSSAQSVGAVSFLNFFDILFAENCV